MKIRDRIIELRRVRAAELRPNPRNWRTHPDRQRDALRGVLAEVGYADALLARELEDGGLELVDGHLRAETTPEAVVPVLVVDLTAEEAEKLLVTLDPLAALAGVDADRLNDLLASVEFESPAVAEMLQELAREVGAGAGAEEESAAPDVEIPECFQVVAECDDEADQEALYDRLRKEGYQCRVLTL